MSPILLAVALPGYATELETAHLLAEVGPQLSLCHVTRHTVACTSVGELSRRYDIVSVEIADEVVERVDQLALQMPDLDEQLMLERLGADPLLMGCGGEGSAAGATFLAGLEKPDPGAFTGIDIDGVCATGLETPELGRGHEIPTMTAAGMGSLTLGTQLTLAFEAEIAPLGDCYGGEASAMDGAEPEETEGSGGAGGASGSGGSDPSFNGTSGTSGSGEATQPSSVTTREVLGHIWNFVTGGDDDPNPETDVDDPGVGVRGECIEGMDCSACAGDDVGRALKEAMLEVGLAQACDPSAMTEEGCFSSTLQTSDTSLSETWNLMCEQMGWLVQPAGPDSTQCIPPETSGLEPELSGCSDPAAMCTEEDNLPRVTVDDVPDFGGGQPDPIDDPWR